MTLSDRIAVMQAGRVMQLGTPEEVYRRPISRFVATFLGTTNLLEGKAARVAGNTVTVALEGGAMVEASAPVPPTPGSPVQLAVRPESILLRSTPEGVPGTVEDVLFQGHRLIALFRTDSGQELRSYMPPSGWRPARGDRAWASWPAAEAGLIQA